MKYDLYKSPKEFFERYDMRRVADDPEAAGLAKKLVGQEYVEVNEAFDLLAALTPGTDEWYDARAHLFNELGDLIYVCADAGFAFGHDLGPILDALHESNMRKVWDDGKTYKDDCGKVLKPPTWRKPDYRAILAEQVDGREAAA